MLDALLHGVVGAAEAVLVHTRQHKKMELA